MIRRIASSLLNDTRGAIAPMVALASVALIGSAGVALDVGLYYANTRNLQAATEAAALSAAIDPANAQSRALAFLQRNGYPDASTLVSVEVGGYCADKDRASSARFIVGSAPADCAGYTKSTAVRLRTTGQSRHYLTGILGGASPIPALSGTATAARIDEAGVEVTTGVLALDVGLVNSLLSALAGRNIALTGLQLQALQASNIDAGLMFDALAVRVGETGTYSDLLQRTVSLADLMAACQAATTDATVAGALQAIAGQVGGAVQVPLAGLFQLGVWKKMPVGGADQKQSLRAGLNSYQLLSYALQTNNRSANLNGLNVGVAGVAQVTLAGTSSAVLERPRFGFGPAGETTVFTSVLRILLKVKLANLGGLLDGLGLGALDQIIGIDIPLLIEIQAGSAKVRSIDCFQQENAATDATVSVDASSGLLSAYLGTLPNDVMTQPFKPVTVSDVSLVDLLGLLKVDIHGSIGPVLGKTQPLEFHQISGGDGIIGHPPSGGTAARVGNVSQLGPLLSGLGSNVQIKACLLNLLGLQVCQGPLINTVITNVTKNLVAPIVALAVDPLVDGLLGALGVRVGFADTWVTGVRCGVPVLV